MDLLKGEIERKRKELEETNVLGSQKKYFKRGDLQQIQTKNYIEKNFAALTKLNEENAAEEGKKTHYGKHDKKHLLKEDEIEKKVLPRHEVVRRLRERNQPIRLFGESDVDSAKRLNIIETSEPKELGMRNDFKTAMDKSEQESLNEIMNSIDAGDPHLGTSRTEVEVKEEAIDFNEILELSKNARERINDSLLVLKYIKFIVKRWGQDLNNRSLDEKLTVKGRIETALHSQTVAYLKPLCRKLKSKTIPDDIIDSLVKIFLSLIDRNYIKANEYFLEMAIGNAPWPIGATMVGIHARPGRERIASKHVAHVLNDETQRKYIQAVKRLISKCQQYFPTDPSRCVEYSIENVQGNTLIPKM